MSDPTVFVEILTDEELAVLARPNALAVAPYLDGLEPGQHYTAKHTAYRGLQARGIVDPIDAEAVEAARSTSDGSIQLMVRRDVRSVVTLREQAELVVAVSRTTNSSHDYWYAYVAGAVVLLEEISSDGMHRFALARDEQLLDLVAAAAVHPDSGAATGYAVAMPVDTDPTPPAAILGQLGQSLLRADLVVRYVGEPDLGTLGVFSGPNGSWLVTGQGGPTPLAHPMTADGLREQLRMFVERLRAEAVSRAGT